jgi:hypothetical protein
MATVHVGANADPHRASFWLAPPEGRSVPAEGRRGIHDALRAHSSRRTTTRGGHSPPRENDRAVHGAPIGDVSVRRAGGAPNAQGCGQREAPAMNVATMYVACRSRDWRPRS